MGTVTARPPRDRQRGNSMVLALIVMSALATLGSLTVVSVQSSLKASTSDRTQAMAIYAAESGAACAMEFLRQNRKLNWPQYLEGGATPVPVWPDPAFLCNHALPGQEGNPFDLDQNAWFEIRFVNNRDDPSGSPTADSDQQVIIRSTGHGPQGSVAVLEWEVKMINLPPPPPPPPAFDPNVDDASVGFTLLGWRVVDL
ncbi:MAG TPA: hypothetical protein VFT22_37680 [Kofleriaceae bacterium]|nr:hypothetical protein [Kofleriaceae bacterium]